MTVYSSPYTSLDLSNGRTSVYDFIFDVKYSDDDKAFIDGLDGNRFITRGDLKRYTLSLASSLKNPASKLKGVSIKRGDVVMIFSPNSIEYPVALLGAVAAGLRVTTANSAYTPRELAHQYKSSRSRLVFAHPALLQVVLDTFKELGVSKKEASARIILLSFSDRIPGSLSEWMKLEDLFGSKTIRPARFDGHASDETVYICYSSGTTGLSKGVEATHFNFTSLLQIIAHIMPFQHGVDIFLGVLPMYHIFGLVQLIHAALWRGVPVVVLPRFQLDTFCQAIQQFRITFIHVVPPILVAIATHPIFDKYDLSSVKYMYSGAAPLTGELCERTVARLRAHGGSPQVSQGYGLTETTSATHVLPLEDALRKAGSIGPLLPNIEARLVNDDEIDVAEGERGELWLKGPIIMKGYLHNEKGTKEAITPDKWYKTGDIATRDKDGYYYIVDRKKELIKYKAFQVPPAELEGLLLSHPRIDDAAVIGIMSKAEATELPRAYVVPKGGLKSLDEAGRQMLSKEVIHWVKERVAHHKQLRGGVICIEAIPKSASGKILRRELRDLAKMDESEGRPKAKL